MGRRSARCCAAAIAAIASAGMGPSSSGAIAVFAILKQLERFDLASLGPSSPAAWHLITESMRLAYADRDLYVGDPITCRYRSPE